MFDLYGFCVKDLHFKEVKLQGQSNHGFYKVNSAGSSEVAHVMFFASLERWHNKLGHPSFRTVHSALKKYAVSHSSKEACIHDNVIFC